VEWYTRRKEEDQEQNLGEHHKSRYERKRNVTFDTKPTIRQVIIIIIIIIRGVLLPALHTCPGMHYR